MVEARRFDCVSTPLSAIAVPLRLIGSCKIHFAFGGLAADDAGAFQFRLVYRNVARGGFGVFLDLCFTFGGFTPLGKCPAVRDDAFQVLVVFRLMDVGITVFGRALQESRLDFFQQSAHGRRESIL